MRNLLYVIALVLAATSGCKVHDYATTPNPISDKSVRAKSIENSTATNPLGNLYFGDLHVHTSLSVDAYMLGTLTGSDQAYRFAKGEEIPTASWRLLDQIRHGINYPEGAEFIVQERAWSSPIRITP